jgi:DNA-binding transcriptional ArsR family regulator
MADIIRFKRRIARKKREAIEDLGFIVRDTRDSFYVMDDEYLNGYSGICGFVANSVYMLLCRHVGKEQVCYPSNAYMAKKLMTTEPTIRKAIKKLEAHKVIKVDRVKGQPNIYTLTNKRMWRKFAPIGDKVIRKKGPSFSVMCVECGNGEGSESCLGCIGGSKFTERKEGNGYAVEEG